MYTPCDKPFQCAYGIWQSRKTTFQKLVKMEKTTTKQERYGVATLKYEETELYTSRFRLIVVGALLRTAKKIHFKSTYDVCC